MEITKNLDSISKIESVLFLARSELDTSSLIINKYDYNTIIAIVNGEAYHIIGNKKYKVTSGDVIYINTNTQFNYVETDTDCETFWFKYGCFDKRTVKKRKDLFYRELNNFAENDYKEYHNRNILTMNKEDLAFISLMYSNMDKEFYKKEANYKLMLYSYFIQLSVFFSRKYKHYKDTILLTENNPKQIIRAIDYIERNYNKKINLDELSEIANMSTNNFLSKFKIYLNTTPITYINNLRIKKACEYIINEEINISDIAYDVGFSDSNYFTRLFKKIMKQSPSDYRKTKIKEQNKVI